MPAGFRFVVKAPAALVSARGWEDDGLSDEHNPLFLDPDFARAALIEPFVAGCGEQAAVALLQFPPTPLAACGGPDGFAAGLQRLLAALPKHPLIAVELRQGNLYTDRYRAVLAAHGAVHCLNVHPRMPGILEQARALVGFAGPALVIRWMLHPAERYASALASWRPFRRIARVDDDARGAIVRLCRRGLARGWPCYVIANNKAEGCAPLSLEALAHRLT